MLAFSIFRPKRRNYDHKELIDMTQIAYLSLAGSLEKNHFKEKSVRELFQGEAYQAEYDKQTALMKKARSRGNRLEVERIKRNIAFIDSIEKGEAPCSSWKIISVHDTNSVNGFYACVISPDKDTAIVSFRGSESNTVKDIEDDWIAADLGLLAGDVTPQQKEGQKYIEEITRKYSRRFERFFLTGHSLGGNLAEHGLYTAARGFKQKVSACYSFDAPGFAQNYLKDPAIAEGILQTKDKVKKYCWSIVGGLLKETVVPIYVRNELDNDKSLNARFQKHSTQFLIYENGYLVEGGKPDVLEKRIDELSERAELLSPKVKEYILRTFAKL